MEDVSPQLEDGFTQIANELLQAITIFDFSKREYKIIFAIIRQTYGWKKKSDRIALSQFEEFTGLKKNHISTTLAELVKNKIVLKQDRFYLLNKHYNEWVQSKNSPKTGPKKESQNRTENSPKIGLVPKQDCENFSPNLGSEESQNRTENSPKTVTTKEKRNYQKKIKDICAQPEILDSKVSKQKTTISVSDMLAEFPDLIEQTAADWLTVRKAKRAPLTPTAWSDTVREIRKSGMSAQVAIAIAVNRSWQGIKAGWLLNHINNEENHGRPGTKTSAQHREEVIRNIRNVDDISWGLSETNSQRGDDIALDQSDFREI